KSHLEGKVSDVKISSKLKKHPVCLTSEGELTIEMEKVLNSMPDGGGMKANKVLEINKDHPVFESLAQSYDKDEDTFKLYTDLLYQQSLLIEGLSVEDPVAFADQIAKLMK
ncbi:MAG TPA: molecular chaperone HtpG, partial [Eubacteriaceae bacterium]|nr:molecular chaperone HtpG [Eubacteriaceae bacterium]